jgi:hypothetical protein
MVPSETNRGAENGHLLARSGVLSFSSGSSPSPQVKAAAFRLATVTGNGEKKSGCRLSRYFVDQGEIDKDISASPSSFPPLAPALQADNHYLIRNAPSNQLRSLSALSLEAALSLPLWLGLWHQ